MNLYSFANSLKALNQGQQTGDHVRKRMGLRDFAAAMESGDYGAASGQLAKMGDVNGALKTRRIPVTDEADQLGNEYTRTRIDDVGLDNQRADRSFQALQAQRGIGNARAQANEIFARNKANSPLGKIQQDYNNGLISQEVRDAAFTKATAASNGSAGPDRLKLFGQEQDLRKEYTGRAETKDFNKVLSAFKKVRGAAEMDSGAGDMSLIFGYMKMLDPGSTVREGEFATAQNSGGVDDKVRGVYNQIISGTRLSSDQRKDFVQSAQGMYGTHAETMQGVQGEYQDIANEWGIDPSRVFKSAPEFEPMQIGTQAPTSDGGYVKRIK